MRRRGLTQTELAKRVGVYPQTVSKWLNGETTPRPPAIAKLANVLDLDLEKLYRVAAGIEDPESNPDLTRPPDDDKPPAELLLRQIQQMKEQLAAIEEAAEAMAREERAAG